MLRYTVTATLLPEHAPSYEAWLREGHVQAVLELGAAFSAEVILLDRDDGKTAIQASYLFPSREVFDAYVAGPATILRQDGLKLWAETGKVLEWARSTGIVRATFPPEEIARGTGGAVVPVPGKREWPELVGRDINEALSIITLERPDIEGIIVPHDSMVTMDICEQRVRLFTKDDKVARLPRVG